MKALGYIADYFDLTKSFPFKERTGTPTTSPGTPTTPAAGSPTTPHGPQITTVSQQSGLAWQIATYCLVLISILASRFCDLYRAGALGGFRLDATYLLFLGIVSLIAFPVVYSKATLNADNPVFVRIALIFTAGMGWEKIVSTAIGK